MAKPKQQKHPHPARAEQHTAEAGIEHLKQEGGAFVAAVEATRMPMVVTDPALANNPIIYANAAFLEMCGYERNEVLGQNYYFLSGDNTDPEVASRIDAVLSARQNIDIEVQYYTKDGRPIWVAQQASPVTDKQGYIIQHFSSFIDITHRKQMEEHLQRTAEELERRVKDRTKKLEEMNDRLKEEVKRRNALEGVLRAALKEKQDLVQEKDGLIKEVNHRVKNTLQAVQSLLTLQSAREDSDQVKNAFQSAGQRLARMAEIHEMLYRNEGYQTIDLANYLKALCQGLSTSFHPDPDQISLTVESDEVAWGPDLVLPLGLIVNEAVTNSLKYAFPQGQKGNICIELHGIPRNMYRLVIRDNGIGMSSKRRENSLGLQLIDLFARQIGGHALIKNEAGTAVTVTFSAAEEWTGPRSQNVLG